MTSDLMRGFTDMVVIYFFMLLGSLTHLIVKTYGSYSEGFTLRFSIIVSLILFWVFLVYIENAEKGIIFPSESDIEKEILEE